MKKEWVKPEIKFITDPDIILGCLYEVYGQEQKSVLAGKNIRHTMIFPFLRMLANNTQGDIRDLEALHQRLWKHYGFLWRRLYLPDCQHQQFHRRSGIRSGYGFRCKKIYVCLCLWRNTG